MSVLFKTVLVLSLFGTAMTSVLICLKPLIKKHFSAKLQYCIYIAVMFSMLIPAYKLIPLKEAQKLTPISQTAVTKSEELSDENIVSSKMPLEYREVNILPRHRIRLFDLSARIWFFGMTAYMLAVTGSYTVYIIRKRRHSVIVSECVLMNETKKELAIHRNIPIRISTDADSPMLVGVLFPCVYIPEREIPHENMHMIFLHELTHYKRKDLLIKWIAVFTNAVHWFNPFAYLLRRTVGEVCEISCDMSVTKNMSEPEQKTYMKTILSLI